MAVTGTQARTVQITFRIPKEWVEEANVIARQMSQPGFEASYTDAMRAAIAKGLEAMRKQYGIEMPKPKGKR